MSRDSRRDRHSPSPNISRQENNRQTSSKHWRGSEASRYKVMNLLHDNIRALPAGQSNITSFSPPRLSPPADLNLDDVELTEAVLSLNRYANTLQHCCSTPPVSSDKTFTQVVLQATRDKPHLNDWLPVELHEENKGWQAFLDNPNPSSMKTCIDWSKPGGCLISRDLDALCFAAGVKSNGGTFSHPLPDLDTVPNIWANALVSIEARIPPSMLVVPVNKTGWGFTHLTPNDLGTGFEETEMVWVDQPACPRFTTAQNKISGRLRDVILKLGNVLTSPQITRALLPRGCYSRDMLLHLMRSPAYSVNLAEDVPARLPAPVRLSPAQFVCWKVSPPRQPIVFEGTPDQYSPLSPHSAPKRAIERERCTASSADVIGLSKRPITEFNVQKIMQNEVRIKLQEMAAETPNLYDSAEDSRSRLHLSLWEGMLTMAREPALLHINIPFNHSLQWDMAHEDPRYSELQVGDDCMLFRDWASVCLAQNKSHKCKMEAHIATVESPTATLIPWIRSNNKLEWVTAVSNHPLPPRVLREKQALYSMKSLLNCIQASKMVDAGNCLGGVTTYINGNQISLCYRAAEGSRFVIFKR